MNETKVHYQKLILQSIDYEKEEEEELSKILDEVRQLNEINGDLSILLNEQNENIDNVITTQDNIELNTEKAIKNLEKAVSNKIKFVPIAIGAIIGASVLGPGSLLVGLKAGAGYVALGGSFVGGLIGKSIS